MTPTLFVKLLRDLRTLWNRILLMILALTLTLLMFSAVFYTWGIANREMPRAYLSTSPASATIILDRGLSADEMAAIAAELRKQPGILDATPRSQYTLQVQQSDGSWGANPLQIFVAMPDDPMQIESFFVEQGTWPPAEGEILLSRYSFDLLGLSVGDEVVVQAINGDAVTLRVSGIVYNPALAPSFQEQKGHGFMSATSLPLFGKPVALNTLKIQVADAPGLIQPGRSREAIEATALATADWMQQTYGVTIREIQIPTPYAHPHQAQADSLLLGLVLFGVTGLLLSAILVATMLNGLFTQQIPQIGIMKAIGARSSRVLQLYLLMTLAIAASSTALAILPGIVISRTFAPVILNLLGIDAESLSAPIWMYVVVIAAGLGMPLLFTLASLINTSRTTVREALDFQGVSLRRTSTAPLGGWLGKLPRMNRTVLLALRNIFRRRARLLLSVGLLASAGTVFLSGMSTLSSFQASLDRDEELRRWDVDVQIANANSLVSDEAANVVGQIPGVTRVEEWSVVQTSIIPSGQAISVTHTYPDQGHGSLTLTAIPSDTTLITAPALVEGRWLRPNETGAVVVSEMALPDEFATIRSGDTIQLHLGGQITQWEVVGIAKSVGGHGGGIFTTRAGFEAATGISQPNLLRIVTNHHDEETRTAVAQEAESALTDAGITVRSAASVSRSASAGAGHMLPLIVVFLALSIAISVVGFAGLASTMSTNVLERTREFGVMSAIGATSSRIRHLVVLEGIFVAAVSCLVAVIPAFVLTAGMINNMPMPVSLPFQFSLPALGVWVIVVIVGAALATLAPASKAARLTVREALAYL